MRKYYLLTMMALSFFQVYAQSFKITRFTGEIGGGFAFQGGGLINVGVSSAFNNKWTLGARYFRFEAKAAVPADYLPRPIYTLTPSSFEVTRHEKIPTAVTGLFIISGGRNFRMSRAFNLTVDVGVGGASGEEYNFTRKPATYLWDAQGLSSNYHVDVAPKNAFAVMFRTGIEGVGGWAGAGLHAFYNYNSGDFGNISGLSLTFMFGWMKRDPKITIN